MSSQDLFNQLAAPLRTAVLANSGGHRTIFEDEFFFPTQEDAKTWAEKNDKGSGYIVGIIAVLVLPNSQRIGLTTITDFDRAHQQADAYMAAHSACEQSRGVMYKVWEVGFL